ncbi:MAG: hypothetical protein PVH37_26455 [Desulfobacterales bacterium]
MFADTVGVSKALAWPKSLRVQGTTLAELSTWYGDLQRHRQVNARG